MSSLFLFCFFLYISIFWCWKKKKKKKWFWFYQNKEIHAHLKNKLNQIINLCNNYMLYTFPSPFLRDIWFILCIKYINFYQLIGVGGENKKGHIVLVFWGLFIFVITWIEIERVSNKISQSLYLDFTCNCRTMQVALCQCSLHIGVSKWMDWIDLD
jgi:hypothetical protein